MARNTVTFTELLKWAKEFDTEVAFFAEEFVKFCIQKTVQESPDM